MNEYIYRVAGNGDMKALDGISTEKKGDMLVIATDRERTDIEKLLREGSLWTEPETIRIEAEIDCPVCAKKVEDAIAKRPEVISTGFSFERSLITVKGYLTREEIKKIAKDTEDDIVFKDERKMRFQVWIDCPVCAKKVETKLLETDGVSAASFQYEKGTLTVTSSLSEQQIKDICLGVEDEMKFLDGKKYRFRVWIDCPVCAKKVEAKLLGTEGVSAASFQYEKGTLTVTSSLSEQQIKDICLGVEDEMKFLADEKKYRFRISIDCPNCAKKVEDRLRNTEGVSEANLDFAKGTLRVTTTLSKEEIKQIAIAASDEIEFLADESISRTEERKIDWQLIRIAVSMVLLGLSFAFDSGILAILSYINAGWDVVWKAVKNCFRGNVFDENFLMTIATIGAVIISSYTEAAGVMVFYQVGEYFQRKAVGKSQKRIETLLDLTAETVHRVNEDGTTVDMAPDAVRTGETIRILPGEKVSIDGVIIDGNSALDMKAINGESVPADVTVGSQILSGSINGSGVLTVKTEKEYSDSTASKIMRLVKESEEKRAKSEAFITRFSKVYTPLVTFLTVLICIVPPLFFGLDVKTWVYRGLMLLVVSCPCALVLSVPLSYFASLGCFAKNGILVKNALTIETLSKVDTVAMDKTGTLTKGNFVVSDQKTVDMDADEALRIAASLEWNSTHPIGTALRSAYRGSPLTVKDIEETAGTGISGNVAGKTWHLGKLNPSGMEGTDAGTAVYLADDEKTYALFTLRDEVKDDSFEGIREMKRVGIKKACMLTGDRKNVAEHVGKELGIDEVYSELLPGDKTGIIEDLKKTGTVLFAGDGINDSPSLITADIGLAMGGVGSDAAIEAADCVLMNDDISKIGLGIEIARKTERIVRENIWFSLGIKVAVIILSIIGISNMWVAVFADTGVAMLAALNAARAGYKKRK